MNHKLSKFLIKKTNLLKSDRHSSSNHTIDIEKLSPSVPGKIYYKKQMTSTNSEAKAQKNVPDKSIFITEYQTDGRGRMGRRWDSPAGYGIWMSIALIPQIPPSSLSQITLVAGLAVSRVIENSAIKWPNDILINNKKVCGIMTESIFNNDKIERVIVGIGVNVNNNSFPEELSDKAASLYTETGHYFNRTQLASEILTEFWALYAKYISYGFAPLKTEYLKKCSTIGKTVCILEKGRKYNAIACDITESGELVVETDSTQRILNSGEVSVRGLLGYH